MVNGILKEENRVHVIWFASCNPQGDMEIWSNTQVRRPDWEPKVGDKVHTDSPGDKQKVFLVYEDGDVPLQSFVSAMNQLHIGDQLHFVVSATAKAYHEALNTKFNRKLPR
jgi:hypothetical protein